MPEEKDKKTGDKPAAKAAELNDTGLMQAVGKPQVSEAEELKAKLEEALQSAKRWQAEFVNYQMRVARDREADRKYGLESMLREMLALVDAVQRSIAESGKVGAPPAAVEAMRLVDKELARLLVRHGVTPIEADSGAFDPSLHDAIGVVETAGHPDGAIVEVVRKGYRLHDRVLRPAQVRVAGKVEKPKA